MFSHRSREMFWPDHSTPLLLALKNPLNLKSPAKKWDILISMKSHAVLYLLTSKFLDQTEKNFILKMFLLNFQKMTKLKTLNCMKSSNNLVKLRVWKPRSMKITLQEDTDLYVSKMYNLLKTLYKTSQDNLRCVNSNQKMLNLPKESWSTIFTSKIFLTIGLTLKSKKCLSLLETSSLVFFNQTVSENSGLFATMIQWIKNTDQNVLKKQSMLWTEEISREVNWSSLLNMLLVNKTEQWKNKEKLSDINSLKKDATCTSKISQILGMKRFYKTFLSNMET